MSKKAKCLKTALIQMCVCPDREKNIASAAKKIKAATCAEAKLIILPECFTMPYAIENFEKYSESQKDGPTCCMLKELSKENCCYIVGGSFPEADCGKVYNTCTVWNPLGEMIAKFRKLHLFDINVPGKITFQESKVLAKGNKLATCKIDGIKTGIGICYDMRFEELAKLYRLKGIKMLIYPAAFNTTTGPLHFELLQRARAVDNQCFVCTCSPARAEKGYQAWGHSQITDPWGKVIVQGKETEEILYGSIDPKVVDDARSALPTFCQRRVDIYDLRESTGGDKKPAKGNKEPPEENKMPEVPRK